VILTWIVGEILAYVERKSEAKRALIIKKVRKEHKELFDLMEGGLIRLLRQGSLKDEPRTPESSIGSS
jgi:hypothetical protein